MKGKLDFNSIKMIFPYFILLIIIALATNVYLYKVEIEKYNENIVAIDKTFDDLKWKYINGIIEEEYRAAGLQAKIIAERIERDIRAEYPDINVLKNELNNPPFDGKCKYLIIFKKNINGMYLYGIKNDNNDPFVANTDGILMDLSLNCSSVESSRIWSKEEPLHSNKELYRESVKRVLHKSPDVKYWEFEKHDNLNHMLITIPTMENLRLLFQSEGLDGLKTIEFLAPAYITESGDIFGSGDIDNTGVRARNHKFIIVQGFNAYDQITAKHMNNLNFFDERKNESIRLLKNSMVINSIVTLTMTMMFLLIIFFLMGLNNKVFHDNSFCRQNNKMKEDEEKT